MRTKSTKPKRAPRARRHTRRHAKAFGIWSAVCRECKQKFRVVHGPKPKYCIKCKSTKLEVKKGRLSPAEKAAQDSAFMFAAGRMASIIMDLFGIPRPEFVPPPPPFQPHTPPAMSREEAALFIASYACVPKDYILDSTEACDRAYKIAARKLHPDTGGSHEEFVKLQEAREVLSL